MIPADDNDNDTNNESNNKSNNLNFLTMIFIYPKLRKCEEHTWYKKIKKITSSLRQPNLYMVGILITNAKMSSMKVLRALYVSILHGRWATDFSL